jgi:hypothetical protein
VSLHDLETQKTSPKVQRFHSCEGLKNPGFVFQEIKVLVFKRFRVSCNDVFEVSGFKDFRTQDFDKISKF